MVHLTRIYTRTGDAGQTRLTDNSVTSKTDPRVGAYGHVDELKSAIGLLLAQYQVDADVRAALELIQNELFDVGADLSNPVVSEPKYEPLRIIASSVDRLEQWCDRFGEDLPALNSFILSGGSPTSAYFHVLRTMTRRAERAAWAAAERYGLEDDPAKAGGGVNLLALRYLNRLSDLFFIFARHANATAGVAEVLWVPGGERNPDAPRR